MILILIILVTTSLSHVGHALDVGTTERQPRVGSRNDLLASSQRSVQAMRRVRIPALDQHDEDGLSVPITDKELITFRPVWSTTAEPPRESLSFRPVVHSDAVPKNIPFFPLTLRASDKKPVADRRTVMSNTKYSTTTAATTTSNTITTNVINTNTSVSSSTTPKPVSTTTPNTTTTQTTTTTTQTTTASTQHPPIIRRVQSFRTTEDTLTAPTTEANPFVRYETPSARSPSSEDEIAPSTEGGRSTNAPPTRTTEGRIRKRKIFKRRRRPKAPPDEEALLEIQDELEDLNTSLLALIKEDEGESEEKPVSEIHHGDVMGLCCACTPPTPEENDESDDIEDFVETPLRRGGKNIKMESADESLTTTTTLKSTTTSKSTKLKSSTSKSRTTKAKTSTSTKKPPETKRKSKKKKGQTKPKLQSTEKPNTETGLPVEEEEALKEELQGVLSQLQFLEAIVSEDATGSQDELEDILALFGEAPPKRDAKKTTTKRPTRGRTTRKTTTKRPNANAWNPVTSYSGRSKTTTGTPAPYTFPSFNSNFESSESVFSASSTTSGKKDSNTATGSSDQASEVKQKLNQYFARLRKIYELDLKMLDSVSNVIDNVQSDLIPSVMRVLEPVMNPSGILGDVTSGINPENILGIVSTAIKQPKVELSVSTKLADLAFLQNDPITIKASDFTNQSELTASLLPGVDDVISSFDQSGLSFPIQYIILGPEAFSMLLRGFDNNRIVSLIIAREIAKYLRGARLSIELAYGEVIIDTRLPPLTLADTCKATVKLKNSHARLVVKKNTRLTAAKSLSLNKKSRSNRNPAYQDFDSHDRGLQAAVVLKGDADVTLSVSAIVHARLEKKIFNKCIDKFRRYLPVGFVTSGKVHIVVKIGTSDVKIERRPRPANMTLNSTNGGSQQRPSYSPPASSYQPSGYQTQHSYGAPVAPPVHSYQSPSSSYHYQQSSEPQFQQGYAPSPSYQQPSSGYPPRPQPVYRPDFSDSYSAPTQNNQQPQFSYSPQQQSPVRQVHGIPSYTDSYGNLIRSYPRSDHAQARTLDLGQLPGLDEIQSGFESFKNFVNSNESNDNTTIPFVVFKPEIKVQGRIKDWEVDKVSMSNCEIRVLGLEVFSFCKQIADGLKNAVEDFTDNFNEMTAPGIERQVAELLNTQIGEEIAIPLEVMDQNNQILSALLAKADNVVQLKTDLVSDFGSLTQNIGSGDGALTRGLESFTKGFGDVVSQGADIAKDLGDIASDIQEIGQSLGTITEPITRGLNKGNDIATRRHLETEQKVLGEVRRLNGVAKNLRRRQEARHRTFVNDHAQGPSIRTPVEPPRHASPVPRPPPVPPPPRQRRRYPWRPRPRQTQRPNG